LEKSISLPWRKVYQEVYRLFEELETVPRESMLVVVDGHVDKH
jgi:hypothetical protein